MKSGENVVYDSNVVTDHLLAETWLNDGDKSVAFIFLNGVNQARRNVRSSTVYEVVSGSGVFHIGRRSQGVEAGSRITIPIGKPYSDEGTLAMLATSTPPFNRKDEITLSLTV